MTDMTDDEGLVRQRIATDDHDGSGSAAFDRILVRLAIQELLIADWERRAWWLATQAARRVAAPFRCPAQYTQADVEQWLHESAGYCPLPKE